MRQSPPLSMAYWLLVVCALILMTALIGAITRLTESGLSMMEWDLHRVLWPTPALLDSYYAQYQTIPQYQVTGFDREEFVSKVFWEWFHRNWGRLVFLVSLGGAVWFFVRRQVPRGFVMAIASVPLLIAVQGLLGIYMVRSGFFTAEDVSHYRLALHLGLAFTSFGLFLWTALRILAPWPQVNVPFRPWLVAAIALGLAMLFGAYTAGLNAGLTSNTYPNFTQDSFLPPEGLCADASRTSLTYWLDSKCGVHFIHRHLAMLAAALVVWASVGTLLPRQGQRASKGARILAYHGIALVLAQVVLGIYLVLTAVPLIPAVAHQFGALALLAVAVLALYFRQRQNA